MPDFYSQFPVAEDLRFPHIYVHLPFCESICHYCDFYVARARQADHGRFFKALRRELELWRPYVAAPVETLYFGGGTPSESPPALLSDFVGEIRETLAPEAEICLEANPTSINAVALQTWRAAGFNRISIGVQTLQPALLRKLSRKHSRETALRAIAEARREFPKVSVDLMYGVPGQNKSELVDDAKTLAGMGVDHLSAYTLTLGEQHFLFSKLPTSEEAMEASEALERTLREQGLEIYEASNYARIGSESRHNQAYWSHRPYLALGPSAHGYDGRLLRWQNVADWQLYSDCLEKGKLPISSRETLSLFNLRTEHLFTRLRTRRGLNFHEYKETFREDLKSLKAEDFAQMAQAGLGNLSANAWKPTFRGLMLADEITLRLEC